MQSTILPYWSSAICLQKSQHWLSVKQCIRFKVVLIMQKILTYPSTIISCYLHQLLHTHANTLVSRNQPSRFAINKDNADQDCITCFQCCCSNHVKELPAEILSIRFHQVHRSLDFGAYRRHLFCTTFEWTSIDGPPLNHCWTAIVTYRSWFMTKSL